MMMMMKWLQKLTKLFRSVVRETCDERQTKLLGWTRPSLARGPLDSSCQRNDATARDCWSCRSHQEGVSPHAPKHTSDMKTWERGKSV